MEERFRKKLTMWKQQYISKEGRLILIRNTLSSLSIYYVFVLDLEDSEIKVGTNSKGLSLGRRDLREKTSFSEAGYCLFK